MRSKMDSAAERKRPECNFADLTSPEYQNRRNLPANSNPMNCGSLAPDYYRRLVRQPKRPWSRCSISRQNAGSRDENWLVQTLAAPLSAELAREASSRTWPSLTQ